MKTVAKVTLWNTQVGAVVWDDEKGFSFFEYDSHFLKKNLDIAPITMPHEDALKGKLIYSFPLLNPETFSGLPGLLADSLPDKFGNRLIDAWLASQGRDPASFNPVERLCYIGKRGMGALEFAPLMFPGKDSSNPLEISRLVELATEILTERKKLKSNLRNHPEDGLMDIIRVGSSAGGARAKAIIAYNEKTGDVRSGQLDELDGFEHWIIKFDGVTNKLLGDPKGYGKIEYAYYLMAVDAGIQISYSKLLKENKRAHFITKRFDRVENKKLHMQTLCALAHFDYNDPNSYSYEQAFQILRQMKLPYLHSEEMFRRMVFNVAARNQDDHTKNIAFLMNEKSEWQLSPAYDLTYAYDPKNKWMKSHQMSINGKSDDIQRKDVLALAKKMNIKHPEDLIEQVLNALSKWKKYSKAAEVDEEQAKRIFQYFNFLK
jgi:serine/threonine-protein kinase HipA